MKIVHEKCDPSLSLDRTLPYTAYLVEYLDGDITCYDIAVSSKKVDIFDYYWDKYKKDFINMTQTEGRVNPKLWSGKESKVAKA